jgi:hypothetical protein|tara:strand:- start:202 stop:408 length:207 start_codon:yes stop_codon:yes gene_type:complete
MPNMKIAQLPIEAHTNIYDAQIENLNCITDLKKRVRKLEKELKQSNEDIQLLAELLTGALDDLNKRSA